MLRNKNVTLAKKATFLKVAFCSIYFFVFVDKSIRIQQVQ